MEKHKGKRLFITGLPTAGKTTLAKKLAEMLGGVCVSSDEIRHELRLNPKYTEFVDFYRNQDKRTYYMETSYEQQWKNFIAQQEGLWEGVLKKINSYSEETKPVIFEGVSILPHLAHKDLNFPGIVIIGTTLESVLERNRQKPRWGNSELELQSAAFFFGERPHFIEEAKKYNYPMFENNEEALNAAVKILS